jgi:hypothetical protein
MDAELTRLIRERYPFPIAYTYKKTLALLDNDAQKLDCLLQAAETVVQFLTLVMLAQLSRDLEHQQAPTLEGQGAHLREDLRKPSFGKWQGIVRDLLTSYRNHRHLLVMPELFDFYFRPGRSSKPRPQPVVTQVLDPLIALRNLKAHDRPSKRQVAEALAVGSGWLEQVLAGLQFLAMYRLAYIQNIQVRHRRHGPRVFHHILVHCNGCFTPFDEQPWDSEVDLCEERPVLLAPQPNGQSLFLDPFLTVTDQVPKQGVLDVLLLNGTDAQQGKYLSVQFGQTATDAPDWTEGKEHLEALSHFFTLLRGAPITNTEVELDEEEPLALALVEERDEPSTVVTIEVPQDDSMAATAPHRNPYKFLDYFEPQDADLFFGREREIHDLERKFHAARLLILYGESGTGKTSLILAGLLPRLAPASYVPIYVRALQEPARAIKEALVRQGSADRHHLDLPLAAFLDTVTAQLRNWPIISS